MVLTTSLKVDQWERDFVYRLIERIDKLIFFRVVTKAQENPCGLQCSIFKQTRTNKKTKQKEANYRNIYVIFNN